jgi:hypothetical protein
LLACLILLREFSLESEVWQLLLLLLLQMLKLGTKFSSIQDLLLQQERRERERQPLEQRETNKCFLPGTTLHSPSELHSTPLKVHANKKK